MKEQILNATLEKVFELASVDLVCPTSKNMQDLSKEELLSLYEKSWSLVLDIHNIAFECKQSMSLLNTLDL